MKNIDKTVLNKFEELQTFAKENNIDITSGKLLDLAQSLIIPCDTYTQKELIKDFNEHLLILCFLSNSEHTDNVPKEISEFQKTLEDMLSIVYNLQSESTEDFGKK
jgi:hypothetical protein